MVSLVHHILKNHLKQEVTFSTIKSPVKNKYFLPLIYHNN